MRAGVSDCAQGRIFARRDFLRTHLARFRARGLIIRAETGEKAGWVGNAGFRVKRGAGGADALNMARNFYFGSDASMVAGSAVFNAGINAEPASLGLTSTQALAYSQVNALLQNAYQLASNPITNSRVAISEKNHAVKSMQRMAKNLSNIIRAQPGVSDAQLIALGLLPRPVRTRRQAPVDPPTVWVLAVVGRRVTIRVCDTSAGSGRSKPPGMAGAEIYWHLGEQPADDALDYRYKCFTTRSKAELIFSNQIASGATIWLSARWVSRSGKTSTPSQPISFTLQGGAITAESSGITRLAA